MRMTLLKWHDMNDIPNYEKLLIVLYYSCGCVHYRIATYWKSDKHFHLDATLGADYPPVLQMDNIVAWAYLPLIVEKQPNNEVE